MKKIIILFIACVLSATISAQITRTIAGLTLGSNYKTVLKDLKKNKVKYVDLKADIDQIILTNDDFTFAGVEWIWPSVEFKDDKVNKIQFTNKSSSEADANRYLEEFKSIAQSLHVKYERYLQNADFHEVDNGAEGILVLCDGKTQIMLIIIHSKVEESALQLIYEDVSGKGIQTQVIDDL